MNHDDPSNKPEAVEDADVAATTEPPAPRKIMLGKRVLRHFHVKSGVRTGMDGVTDTGGTRCHSQNA
jgi:hypothetical protein